MLYHGTNVGNIKVLNPTDSNQGKLVYLASNKMAILPYLANPIQSYLNKKYGENKKKAEERWAVYKAEEDGTFKFFEFYPGMLKETFSGVKGYIYHVKENDDMIEIKEIKNAYGCSHSVPVEKVEVLDDIYEELQKLQQQGKAKLFEFDKQSEKSREFAYSTIVKDLERVKNDEPNYYEFLTHAKAKIDEYNLENSKKA